MPTIGKTSKMQNPVQFDLNQVKKKGGEGGAEESCLMSIVFQFCEMQKFRRLVAQQCDYT